MAAVLTEMRRSDSQVLPTPHLTVVRSGRDVASLRTLPVSRRSGRTAPVGITSVRPPAGRSRRRPDAAVYRRRRLLAGGLFLLAIAAVLILAQLIQAGIGGGPLTTTGAAAGPGMVPAGANEYVVRPGDTLWTIAASLAPGRDERPLVDALSREAGSSSLYPGEVLRIPGR